MAAPRPRVCCTFYIQTCDVVWRLGHLKAKHTPRLRRKHKAELDKLPNDDARAVRVAELNVHQSIDVLKQHPAIKKAMNDRGLTLHGMIYDIGAGHLKLLEATAAKKGNGLWTPN